MSQAVVEAINIHKSFQTGSQQVPILKGLDFKVNKGDFFVVFGPSGCGKSTLLHVVLGLEQPEKGQAKLLGKNIYLNKTEDEKAEFRKKHIGVVYQQTYWIRSLSVLQNVAFPLQLLGQEKSLALARAMQMLEEVEMADWADYVPTELSSGQQQRVNLARAMINDPEILVTDEPTGNLDYESGQELMRLIADLNQKGKTIVMVTHDLEFLNYATKAAEMKDGRLGEVYLGKAKEDLYQTIKKKKFDPRKKS